nr:MAG TPA: hypothetical protein [Caudoviricetes sp.]
MLLIKISHRIDYDLPLRVRSFLPYSHVLFNDYIVSSDYTFIPRLYVRGLFVVSTVPYIGFTTVLSCH